MNRRNFLTTASGVSLMSIFGRTASAAGNPGADAVKTALQQANAPAPVITKLALSDADWKKRLSQSQYRVLREEATDPPFTSNLNDEKRKGIFHCAGCDLPVYTSEMKFDSGTGWPSFFTTLPGVFEKKRDFKLIYPRTEYHCAKCGGHHGHVFTDGPAPTNQRWCNNGSALIFKAA